MEFLKTIDLYDLRQLLTEREGETKLGQQVTFFKGNELPSEHFKAGKRYVIIGVPESIGPKANKGKGGAEKAWEAFLPAFLNIQVNYTLDPKEILVGGVVHLADLQQQANGLEQADADYLLEMRELCELIDQRVKEVVTPWMEAGLIPIVIGGGHNNAYPLINAAYQVQKHPVTVINCDAHADFRKLEGRHSGNSFSYAYEHKLLRAYRVLGLHKNYNGGDMLERMIQADDIYFSFFEDVKDWYDHIDEAFEQLDAKEDQLGVELDMDSIKLMPASAWTPDGIELKEARYYLRKMAQFEAIRYVHLPEAAPETAQQRLLVGKALSFLVSDFIRERQNLSN